MVPLLSLIPDSAMKQSPATAALILDEAEKVLHGPGSDGQKLERLWKTLAFLQANALANGIKHLIGDKVYSGPLKGMQLNHAALIGAFAPHLLGAYEWELHPTFQWVIKQPYKQILNIGCSFGYYSVGLALKMPQATVHAFDIDAEARKKCRDLAQLNRVQDRVKIAGEFRGEDFASYPPEETLVLIDIEGGEVALLDPARFPALQKMDIIVELHDVFDPAISQIIRDRFASSHEVEIIHNRPLLFDISGILDPGYYLDPFDHLLLGWENRDGPTPWAVMKSKSKLKQ